MSQSGAPYPRQLTLREREWINWILPANRSGYRHYREMIEHMSVLGEGRRGNGEIILGTEGNAVDFSAPLAPVFAYGAIETNFEMISITVREQLNDQISVEIVSHRAQDVPEDFEESRRWSYSTWSPGQRCPQCGKSLREVSMHPATAQQIHFTLAICQLDKRIWVYDSTTQVNRLIPMTNFYNELMLHKNIRDPKIALNAKRLFEELSSYTDPDLTYAFLTYNKLRSKIHVAGTIEPDQQSRHSFGQTLRTMFKRPS